MSRHGYSLIKPVFTVTYRASSTLHAVLDIQNGPTSENRSHFAYNFVKSTLIFAIFALL